VIQNSDGEIGITTTMGKGTTTTPNNKGRGETRQEGSYNNNSDWEDANKDNSEDEGNQRTRKEGNDGDDRDDENQDQTGMKEGHQTAGK
jgi:hypothetical protein